MLGQGDGTLTPDAAEHLGLAQGTPVAQGGIDAYLGMLGLGAVKPGDLALIMGSSTCQLALSRDPVLGSGLAKLGSGLAGVLNAVARLPGRWASVPQPQQDTGPGDLEGTVGYEPDRVGTATLPAGTEPSPRGLASMRPRVLRMGAVKLVLELAFFSNTMVKALRRPATVYHVHDSYPLIVRYTLAKLHRA